MSTGEEVGIDWDRVDVLAKSLAALPRSPDFPHQVVRIVAAGDEDCYRAFLWAAAICHSTHGGLRGTRHSRLYNGWDFLLESFSVWAEDDPDRLSPRAIATISQAELLNLLVGPFTEPHVTLTDLDRRASILREVAVELGQSYGGQVGSLLSLSSNRVGGDIGAYSRLRHLPGFADPLDKKSSAFLMAVHFSGRWRPVDQDAVRPMIDYHRMRLFMRTGCIVPHSTELATSLRVRSEVSNGAASAIREAAMTICSAVPARTGLDVFEFDVLLWALARSCCRNRPLCVEKGPENRSFYLYTGLPEEGPCVLTEVCPGARDAETRSFWEPAVETEDY